MRPDVRPRDAERALQREPVLAAVHRHRRLALRRRSPTSTTSSPATTTGTRCCSSSRPTAGVRSVPRSRSATTTTCPNCDTYQGAGADPGRACVPEKGPTSHSIFRATNYPSGAVNPNDPSQVVVTYGSYINSTLERDERLRAAGFGDDGINEYAGVKTAGRVQQQDPDQRVSERAARASRAVRVQPTRARRRRSTSRPRRPARQFWQWEAFNKDGKLAVSYYDRQYGTDETTGSLGLHLSGSKDLAAFGDEAGHLLIDAATDPVLGSVLR